MSSPEVLPEQPVSSTSYESETEYEDEDFGDGPKGRISVRTSSTDMESSIAKLPGTALLKSVHNKQMVGSNHDSLKSLQSDHTYDFKRNSMLIEDVDEFGGDAVGSFDSPRISGIHKIPIDSPSRPPKPPTGKVPAWKLRQQAQESDVPPPPKKLIGSPENGQSKKAGSPIRSARKNGSSNGDPSSSSWFQKLTAKKETPEEKEKRLKNEALLEKQVPSRWGKDILEEDDEEEKDAVPELKEEAENTATEAEEDETDTVKQVKNLIEKSFGSALVAFKGKESESANGGEDQADDEDGERGPKKAPPMGRGNRWAMMGSAAMTSVRNIQRGLMKEDANDNNNSQSIAEGDEKDDVGESLGKLEELLESPNRRPNMWKNRGAAAFTSMRNVLGGGAASRRRSLLNPDESSSHADDDLDSKSVHSDPGKLNRESSSDNDKDNNNKLLSSIATFWEHTRAKFDPEVWADPEVQESVAAIEKLRKQLDDCRADYRSNTRRRERQIENSIRQQKTFLTRKLHRNMYGYKKDPFHPCIKDVYQKEILIIVHEATSLGGDDDSELEKDGIDDLLASERFDYDYKPEETDEANKNNEGLGAFFSKVGGGDNEKSGETSSVVGSIFSTDSAGVGHDSMVPLETRLIRAQHNEWMTDHQMELARSFQQKSIEHLYDLLPELRKDHEKLKAIPQEALDVKVKELEAYNKELREAYQAHLEAQEKLLAIYRERYTPSVDEEDEDEKKEEDKEKNGEEEDAFDPTSIDAPSSPSPPKRPGMWAKNLSQSVRGLFGPKPDENEEKNGKDDASEGNSSHASSKDGFSLSSPLSSPVPGENAKNKFLLSFGSQAGSAAASGILANFAPPSLGSKDTKGTTAEKESVTTASQQESAKDDAAAAWTVPKMDKGSLPETLAEKRAKRAAARKASRPDAVPATESSSRATTNGAAATASSSSRSELLRRARQARKESAAALGTSVEPGSPTPSNRTGRSSLRSATSASRKELSMKDLMAAAGDSRRKLEENDSRMERLNHKKNQLRKASPLTASSDAKPSSVRGSSSLSDDRRLRIVRELRQDDSLTLSSHHSLHERKPRGRSLKKSTDLGDESSKGEEPVNENLQDVDEFGGEGISSAAR